MCVNQSGYQVPVFKKPDGSIQWEFNTKHNWVPWVDEDTGQLMEAIPIRCGHCSECIKQHKAEWVCRLQDEASLWPVNSFITLTYAKAPEQGVDKTHWQAFMKRLRDRVDPLKVRFFSCGEYGSRFSRPHMHACIFNFDFPDKVFFKFDKKGVSLYRSKLLEDLWPYGFSSVAAVCPQTLEYVTKDMQKLLPKNEKRNPPWILSSRRPGIGAGAINPDMLTDGKIYHGSRYTTLPRFYVNKLVDAGYDVSDFKVAQARNAELLDQISDMDSRRDADKKWFYNLTHR